MVKTAIAECNLNSFMCLHERPYRLEAFVEYLSKCKVTDVDYWETLAWADRVSRRASL